MLTPASRRRIAALGRNGDDGDVYRALEYAAWLLRAKGVAYEWVEADLHLDSLNGISYVQRESPEWETVAYDHKRQRFIWNYKPSGSR